MSCVLITLMSVQAATQRPINNNKIGMSAISPEVMKYQDMPDPLHTPTWASTWPSSSTFAGQSVGMRRRLRALSARSQARRDEVRAPQAHPAVGCLPAARAASRTQFTLAAIAQNLDGWRCIYLLLPFALQAAGA